MKNLILLLTFTFSVAFSFSSEKSLDTLIKESEQGEIKGQFNISMSHDRGGSASQDYAEALKEYRKTVEQGKIAIIIEDQGQPPQAASFGQSLKVIVTDTEDVLVSYAKVTVVNVRTGTKYTPIPLNVGQYQVRQLPTGTYRVGVYREGFFPQHQDVNVTAGQVVALDYQLERIHNTANPMGLILLGSIYAVPALPLAVVFYLLGHFRRRIRWSVDEVLILFAPLLVYWTLDANGVIPLSVRGPAALEELRSWHAGGDSTKGYMSILDVLVCGFFAGFIPLARVWTSGSRIWTWASATVVILIALALYFLTPAYFSK